MGAQVLPKLTKIEPISGRADRASGTETVDTGSIPYRVKSKTIKLVFTACLLDVQQLKEECEASIECGRQEAAWFEDQKVFLLSPDQGNLVNKI